MYNYIDNVDDQIIGVYSGYKIDWDYGSKSNNPYPINCEHTVPQSFFKARAPMKSDLHHIFLHSTNGTLIEVTHHMVTSTIVKL